MLSSQSYGFPVVVYRCESWTIKKAEREELMILNCGLLRVPWTARRSNQSILKEINPEYSLEVLMQNWSSNNLITWFKEPTHWKIVLMLGKIEGKRRGWQRMRSLDNVTNSMDEFEQTPGDSEEQGNLVCWSWWGRKKSDTTWWLNNKCLIGVKISSW